MLRSFVFAALGGATLLGSVAPAAANNYQLRMIVNTVEVTVSCFRGPFTDIIWDRPNVIFLDTLVEAGYTFPEAHAIGVRLCSDPAAVNSPDTAIEVMRRIIQENPPG